YACGPSQSVVLVPELVVPAVPDSQRLSTHLIQRPTLTCVHAVLMDLPAYHVVVVRHDSSVKRIGDRKLISLNVELRAGCKVLLDGGVLVDEPVVSNGQETAAHRIEVGCRGRIRVYRCFLCGSLLVESHASGDTLLIPSRQVIANGNPCDKTSHVRVIGGIAKQDGIVHVPGLLTPGIETHFLECMFGGKGGHHPFSRVVDQDGADANDFRELKFLRRAEEWLVLPDGLPFVVENRPPASYPSRMDLRPSRTQRAR